MSISGRIVVSEATRAGTRAELAFLRRYEWVVERDGSAWVAVLVDRTPEVAGSLGGTTCGHRHRKFIPATDCGPALWDRMGNEIRDAAYRAARDAEVAARAAERMGVLF